MNTDEPLESINDFEAFVKRHSELKPYADMVKQGFLNSTNREIKNLLNDKYKQILADIRQVKREAVDAKNFDILNRLFPEMNE